MNIENPIIELRRVNKSFGAQRVLDDIDLRVERGRTTVIIGRSGTGKSVLLKHIVGLLKPDRGEVYYEGRRIDALTERQLTPVRRQISFVFQLNALFDSMTVGENVAFPMTENSESRPDRARIRELTQRSLKIVGLSSFENKRPSELSGGEKKRVALARAITMDPPPKVILYDEPTAGLDPQRSDVINKLIRSLQDEFHVTGIVVTHDMKLAIDVGDRVLMLHQGRFIADSPPAELAQDRNEIVRNFVAGIADESELATLVR
ncbi:MAG: ATP-binding cassette domain-containing protein [Phycisphaerales bacterium]|nr:ATP-binding cassette domain-containing protein [Phycisphaerales bacterium]